ncbi:hypothetical protein DFH06DRAFT_1397444 [Mycena polygramma]|nr:hypothetical protein DFH06DRAFT_1397444 [Mycena polygramma]
MPTAGAEATRNAEMKYVGKERVPEQKAKVNECRRGMDVGERKLLGGMDRDVGQDSKAKQQGTSDRIPTEIRMRLIQSDTQPNSAGRTRGVQKQIRNGSESSERKETRKEQREEVATGSTRESAGGMFMKNEIPGGGPSKAPKVWWSLGRCRPEGVTEVRRIRTKVGRWNSSEEQSGMVKQSSEVMQQIGSNHIPTEIFGDIRICGGFKARCSEPKPSQDREFREEFAERARGVATENSGAADRKSEVSRRKLRRLDGTVGDVGRRDDRSPEDADKMSGGGTAQSDNATCKLQQHLRDVRNQKDRDRGSEGNFAKSCEGNRRRAPKSAGGANRGLEGSTKRDPRLNGASETQGRKVTEIWESRRKIWPGPGEDVWDFGKDVRDPERPESFSVASLGNRKSQNTIRTSVRVRASGDDNVGTTPERLEAEPEWNFRTDNPAKASLTGGYRVKAECQRKGSGMSRSDRINRKVRVEAQGRRRGRSGSGGRAERNQANPMVRNELQKSEGRGEEPRDSGDKMPEVSETTEMEERKCRGIRDPKSVPENSREGQNRGTRLNPSAESDIRLRSEPNRKTRSQPSRKHHSLRLREEWKGGKEVVNDPDRSRSWGRAEDQRRPEISRADGEVARADRSTEGQRPEVVRTEVGGRTGGEPEVIGTESE